MLKVNIPTKFSIPFASSAGPSYIRTIPNASQIGIQNGAASNTDGFPPLCFQPLQAGGVAPFGQDFNGLFNQITKWSQWQAAGAPAVYDGTFQTNVGGYPQGAIVASATTVSLFWLSIVDSNLTNPDTGGAGWVAFTVGRVQLSANTNFYVSTTGSDSNNGLSTGTAWLTVQNALNVLSTQYDLNGFIATINLADGTYSSATAIVVPPFVGGTNLPPVTITGSPAAIMVYTGAYSGSGTSFAIRAIGGGAAISINGITINAATAGTLQALLGGYIRFTGVTFGAVSNSGVFGAQLNALENGIIQAGGAFTIAGGGYSYAAVTDGGKIILETPMTFSNAVTFTEGIQVSTLGLVEAVGATFVNPGNVTGQRYNVSSNGVINTNGGGGSFFPGTVAGATATGGQYV